jgi:Tfp pilus assembly protein PilV
VRVVHAHLSPFRRRFSIRAGGYTLVEVMVATGLLAITLLAILGGLFYAYGTASAVRYRDNAHFILKSLGDQFLVMPSQTTTGGFNPMWANTGTTPTGVGLSWQDFNGTTTSTSTGTATGLAVTLGGTSGNPLAANVTRTINYLDTTGQIVSSTSPTSAGYLLRGDFTITYTFRGQQQSQTLSLVRAWP